MLMFSVCLYVFPHSSLQPMHYVRIAEVAILPRAYAKQLQRAASLPD